MAFTPPRGVFLPAKRPTTLFLCVALLSPSAGHGHDRRDDPERLTVMTFNAEFLWDGRGREEGQVDFPWKGNPDEADDHMRAVSEVIKRSKADIVNLVEVESKVALDHLNDQFLAGEQYTAHLTKGTDTYTGQDVGLLTRIDPLAFDRTEQAGSSATATKVVSKNYYAKFRVGEHDIAVIGLHFLAHPNSPSRAADREAQADAMRNLAVSLFNEGYQIIMLGDFNDYDGEELSRDHINSHPITDVLEIARELDPADSRDDLINVARLLDQSQRYTAFWDKNQNDRIEHPYELTGIDHILTSPALSRLIESVSVDHAHDPRLVSDHFPVVVTFDFSRPTSPSQSSTADRRTVIIVSVLPNPGGDERTDEQATLRNDSASIVQLTGWRLRDAAGRTWTLTGTLPPNGTVTISRDGQPMALNNDGDTIDLIDAHDRVIDRAVYYDADQDQVVVFK